MILVSVSRVDLQKSKAIPIPDASAKINGLQLAGDDKVSVTAEVDYYVLTTTGDYQNVGTIADDNDNVSITVEDIQDFTVIAGDFDDVNTSEGDQN